MSDDGGGVGERRWAAGEAEAEREREGRPLGDTPEASSERVAAAERSGVLRLGMVRESDLLWDDGERRLGGGAVYVCTSCEVTGVTGIAQHPCVALGGAPEARKWISQKRLAAVMRGVNLVERRSRGITESGYAWTACPGDSWKVGAAVTRTRTSFLLDGDW